MSLTVSDLLTLWLRDGAKDRRQCERRAMKAYESMRDKDTAYAKAIRSIAEVHGKAAAVYDRAIEAVEKAVQP